MIATPRRGYTLVELLVVILIMVILVAVTLPVAKSVMESSRTREASRQLNGNFAMARTYAGRNGRPFGLWFEYDQPVGNAVAGLRQCTRVYLAEVQPPYAGGTQSSRGIIRIESGQTLAEFVPVTGFDTTPADGIIDADPVEKAYLLALINAGEFAVIRFDFKGEWYRLYRGLATNPLRPDPSRLYYEPPNSIGPPGNGSNTSIGFRFQILRTPRRVGNPMELTGGTCIDVEYSGMGPDGIQFGLLANNSLVVMFGAGGGIDNLFLDGTPTTPTGTLHFLIGKVEKVDLPLGANAAHVSTFNMFDLLRSNLADPNSVWVSVGRLNGATTSAENMPDENHGPSHLSPWSPAGQAEYLEECRQVATGREQMGGK